MAATLTSYWNRKFFFLILQSNAWIELILIFEIRESLGVHFPQACCLFNDNCIFLVWYCLETLLPSILFYPIPSSALQSYTSLSHSHLVWNSPSFFVKCFLQAYQRIHPLSSCIIGIFPLFIATKLPKFFNCMGQCTSKRAHHCSSHVASSERRVILCSLVPRATECSCWSIIRTKTSQHWHLTTNEVVEAEAIEEEELIGTRHRGIELTWNEPTAQEKDIPFVKNAEP